MHGSNIFSIHVDVTNRFMTIDLIQNWADQFQNRLCALIQTGLTSFKTGYVHALVRNRYTLCEL